LQVAKVAVERNSVLASRIAFDAARYPDAITFCELLAG
jgi:hypothetical protein